MNAFNDTVERANLLKLLEYHIEKGNRVVTRGKDCFIVCKDKAGRPIIGEAIRGNRFLTALMETHEFLSIEKVYEFLKPRSIWLTASYIKGAPMFFEEKPSRNLKKKEWVGEWAVASNSLAFIQYFNLSWEDEPLELIFSMPYRGESFEF